MTARFGRLSPQKRAAYNDAVDREAIADGLTVRLAINPVAYCTDHFDRVYDEHAERLGRRIQMRIRPCGVVATTPADRMAAEAIIADIEREAGC